MVKQEVASVLRLGAAEVGGLLGGETPVRATRGAVPRTALGHRRLEQARVRELARMQGALPVEREVLRRLVQDDELLFVYSTLGRMEPHIEAVEWFSDPLLREAYSLLASGVDPDTLIHDERFAELFAELLSAEPLVDDNERLLLRHRTEVVLRLVSEHSEAERKKTAEGDVDGAQAETKLVEELKALIPSEPHSRSKPLMPVEYWNAWLREKAGSSSSEK